MKININIPTPITEIKSDLIASKKLSVFVKREDLIHPIISGNKWRKLKYNFEYMKQKKINKVLSFGGAYSNHLHALSWYANFNKIKSIGIVRGEKSTKLNSTLMFCKKNNMDLYYLDRDTYRTNKYSNDLIIDIKKKFKNIHILPEGGCNFLGVKGCKEILDELDEKYNFICASFGTGCTSAGIINSLRQNEYFLAFSSLKGGEKMKKNISDMSNNSKKWQIISDYHFGGFAKKNKKLDDFIKDFYFNHKIKLDPVYTGKLFFGIFDLISRDYFKPKSKILIIHTGGLQGIQK